MTNFCQIYANKMRRISQKDFETYERIKQFMIEHKFSEEDLRRNVKSEVHLEVNSKGMELIKFESLEKAAAFMGVLMSTLAYAYKHKRPLSGGKVEPKYSSSSGLRIARRHINYPS